jgi:cellulose 1,4-beta-cellobiosidase
MCISGQTQLDPTFAAWGAGIGLSLNETGAANGGVSVKSAYNGTANGVAGFAISITGSTGNLPLRVGFTPAAGNSNLAAPHWEVPGPGDHTVMIADAIVPASWDAENAGAYADPSSVFDLQIQVVGAEADAAYDFCVSSVTPVGMDGGVIVGNMPSAYGGQLCGQYDTIDLGAAFTVQNNFWNQGLAQGSQCITALWDNAGTAGFIAAPSAITIDAETGPASYPSVILGWHYGQFHGAYSSARTLSSLSTIPSTWSYTVPTGTESYNVSYDAWIHSNPNPGDPGGGLELMVWTNHRDTTPIGSIVAPSVGIDGGTWEVWYGPNSRGWNTVSYVNTSNPTAVNLDIGQFITEAVTRDYASGSDYLLGVQAGFEIWRSSTQMTSNSYTITIN